MSDNEQLYSGPVIAPLPPWIWDDHGPRTQPNNANSDIPFQQEPDLVDTNVQAALPSETGSHVPNATIGCDTDIPLPDPDLLDPYVQAAWPGEISSPVPNPIIDCNGCSHFECLSTVRLSTAGSITIHEAQVWFRNHNLLFRHRMCQDCKMVSKGALDPICISKPFPGCKKQLFFGPPLMDSYNRFSSKQALLTVIGAGLKLSAKNLSSLVGVSRPTMSSKLEEQCGRPCLTDTLCGRKPWKSKSRRVTKQYSASENMKEGRESTTICGVRP